MLHTEALADLAEGDLDRADALFARAADAASRVGNRPSLSILLAERGIAAVERNDWTAAAAFAEQAVAIVRDGHYDEYWTSCLVFAWSARVALHRGDAAEGRQFIVLGHAAAAAAHLRAPGRVGSGLARDGPGVPRTR